MLQKALALSVQLNNTNNHRHKYTIPVLRSGSVALISDSMPHLSARTKIMSFGTRMKTNAQGPKREEVAGIQRKLYSGEH
jgi:hypothetical protein